MRKWMICFCVLLVLICTGCENTEQREPLALYYRAAEISYSDNGLVRPEAADRALSRDVDSVAIRYFAGPQSDELVSPFPKGTELIGYDLIDGILYLELSGTMAGLGGADLSLALTCINLTFSQLDRVTAIEISAPGYQLAGQESIRLQADQILLEDNSLEIAEDSLNIYYADESNRYLIPTQIKTKLESVPEQAAYAVSMLAQMPEDTGLRRTLPRNTEILDLSIENEVCILDLSDDFYRNRPTSEAEERMTILSIVNTLTEFEGIESVQFYVEGAALTTYHTMDLSLRYQRDEMAVGPVRSGLNEFDASLYIIRKNDWVLTKIPFRVKSAVNETESDAVIQALLHYGERNGFISPIPVDTQVLTLTERGNHCYLDLSKDFAEGLNTKESEELAVRSIVSSLTSLGKIRFVTITIEGKAAGLQYVDLANVFES